MKMEGIALSPKLAVVVVAGSVVGVVCVAFDVATALDVAAAALVLGATTVELALQQAISTAKSPTAKKY